MVMEGLKSILPFQMAHLAAGHPSLPSDGGPDFLKEELQRKLHNPRRVRGVDHAKSGEMSSIRVNLLRVANVAIWLTKLRMIEGVKEFCTKLQIHAFLDECVF